MINGDNYTVVYGQNIVRNKVHVTRQDSIRDRSAHKDTHIVEEYTIQNAPNNII